MLRREQAEHLLDAYVAMENGGGDNRARQALREVIIDEMSLVAGHFTYGDPYMTIRPMKGRRGHVKTIQ